MTIPEPEVGQVISYGYLWNREDESGRRDAAKARPCAIVVAIAPKRDGETGTAVAAVPITHSPPGDPALAIEIPILVKRRLGLDDEPSWIVLTEINRFIWPGPDLAPIRARTRAKEMIYGTLPRRMIEQMLAILSAEIRAGRLRVVKRTE